MVILHLLLEGDHLPNTSRMYQSQSEHAPQVRGRAQTKSHRYPLELTDYLQAIYGAG